MLSKKDISQEEYMRRQNKLYGFGLEQVHHVEWGHFHPLYGEKRPSEIWRSNNYLLFIFAFESHERISVLRTELNIAGRFAQGISWDDLMRLKSECGRGKEWAVECYPPDDEVVNVQNMRHLWLLRTAPLYGWHSVAKSE